MTKDIILDVYGIPENEKKMVSKSGEKLTYFYKGTETNRVCIN
tara:strand:+ start:119 stop:247 length:129 start_codon:yes stop_codon:yes gene_type:complete